MKQALPKRALRRGVSLVETMVAIGVLAIVGPLAVAALLKSGEGGAAARAETRAPAIVDLSLSELNLALGSGSEHLPKLEPGMAFGANTPLCLAFSRDGTLLGSVGGGGYEQGSGEVGGEDASYLARLEGTLDTSRPGYPPLLTVLVSVEFPAVAPADRRRKIPFYTKLP
jgi:type II secretory pathway pseudopilin PulG